MAKAKKKPDKKKAGALPTIKNLGGGQWELLDLPDNLDAVISKVRVQEAFQLLPNLFPARTVYGIDIFDSTVDDDDEAHIESQTFGSFEECLEYVLAAA